MTLEQLRIFVAVAEREHVTQAAADLHLTQSATSAAITALETRYAIRLFDRIGRRIALTEAGRLFLVRARSILASAQDAEAMLADVADMRCGTLTVAASQTIGAYWIPRVINSFRQKHPGLKVSLELGNTEWVAARVGEGAVALGFVEGPLDDPRLSIETLFADELALVAAPHDPWLGHNGSLSERLRDAQWVVREAGSGTRSAFEAVLAAYGVPASDIQVTLEMPSNETVLSAVEAGAGATILSQMVVACALKAGVLKRVDADLPQRNFSVLHHRERYHSRAASEFTELARAWHPRPTGPA
ncbi:LysR family transcriptional regulator [Oryzibacter oryziterrae]|uniref:LysR family transcriptional regulator n=1 Tax=Oryzibacter oryziterrae TaxID=2766474 RepID=UPI001F28354F|nr:LysR family transcriptional regulator [Oryzibacter oryziterrae]